MTLRELKRLRKDTLVPSDIAPILGCNKFSINTQAKEDPAKLGFPVIILGTRVLIPRLGFIRFMEGKMSNDTGRTERTGKESPEVP